MEISKKEKETIDIEAELRSKLEEYNTKLRESEDPEKDTKACKIKIESLVRKHLVRFRKNADNEELNFEKMFNFLNLVNE